MKTFLFGFFLILLSLLSTAQTPLELCKKSVSAYCKKNYTLYKAAEWKKLEIIPYDFEDYSIDYRLLNITQKAFEMSDTLNLKQVKKHIKKYSLKVFESEQEIGYAQDIYIEKINGVIYYVIPIREFSKYGNVLDTLKFYSKAASADVFLQYTPEDDLRIYSFEPERATTTKNVYKITHTYEALTKGGFKKYFTSNFYIKMKNYEIINEIDY